MKIVLFSLFFLILIGMISYSYAEYSVPKKNTILPEVLVQLELRDSNGNFIQYLEGDTIMAIDTLKLNRFLDNLNNTSKEFFIKDDKKYEIQQWEKSRETFTQKTAPSVYFIVDIYQNEFQTLLSILINSFQSEPGDTMRVFWTIIRPVS